MTDPGHGDLQALVAAALQDAMTVWVVPASLDVSKRLRADPRRTGPAADGVAGIVPLLLVLPEVTAQIVEGPDALIDVLISALLGSGYALMGRLEPTHIVAAPVVAGWETVLDSRTPQARVNDAAGGALYAGELLAPPRWRAAASAHGEVIVLVGTTPDARVDDIEGGLSAAAASGRLVGGRMPVRQAPLA